VNILRVENEFEIIKETNYWDSEYAMRGLFYVSINAGGYRLLVPEKQEFTIKEMVTGKAAIISRGPWTAQGNRDAIEIMFDDASDSPYALHLDAQQFDRLPAASDQGWKGTLLVYTVGLCLALTLPVYYRQVKEIPCLQPVAK
jgi:hypothetical protein